jgi:serine/threonine-protein kinase RsbW
MNGERVSLHIPAKAEYLVTARLVAASVVGKLGFDMETVEDMKTACSEACLLLLPFTSVGDDVQIEFVLETEGLRVTISAPHSGGKATDQESEFGVFLLDALTDEMEFSLFDGRGEYKLFKALENK